MTKGRLPPRVFRHRRGKLRQVAADVRICLQCPRTPGPKGHAVHTAISLRRCGHQAPPGEGRSLQCECGHNPAGLDGRSLLAPQANDIMVDAQQVVLFDNGQPLPATQHHAREVVRHARRQRRKVATARVANVKLASPDEQYDAALGDLTPKQKLEEAEVRPQLQHLRRARQECRSRHLRRTGALVGKAPLRQV